MKFYSDQFNRICVIEQVALKNIVHILQRAHFKKCPLIGWVL